MKRVTTANDLDKLRLWLKILTAQQCNGNECCGNSSPTCLFIECCRGRRRTAILPTLAERWTIRRLKYFNHFLTMSSRKVFFGPSAFRSLRVFRGPSSLRKNDLAQRRGYCWGSSSPWKVSRKNTFDKIIQRLVKATFSLGLAPQDEDST
jgi:hypothetical protein